MIDPVGILLTALFSAAVFGSAILAMRRDIERMERRNEKPQRPIQRYHSWENRQGQKVTALGPGRKLISPPQNRKK